MSSLSSIATFVLLQLNWAILVYLVLVNGFYLLLLLSSSRELARRLREMRRETRHRVLSCELAPRISVLVPAYNEASSIAQSLQALATLDYPNLEIVVVDDGSSDETLNVLLAAFELRPVALVAERRLQTNPVRATYRSPRFPGLVVASKDNGGKADALNAALCMATGELVCAVDADTIIEPDALQRLVRPFLGSRDLVAAGATIRVANGSVIERGRIVREGAPRELLAGVQAVEYLRAFLFGRVGWNRIGGNLVISGAFGLFRRDALLDIDGYAAGVGEDMELVTRLRRRGYELRQPRAIEFVADPVAWTEVPESLRVLGRQRDRWHRGLSETLWRHRRLMFNPRYGVLGLFVFPVFVLIEWLAPLVEGLGLISLPLGLALGVVDPSFALIYFLAAYGLGMLLSSVALLFEEFAFRGYGSAGDRSILLLWAFVENLGYRQLTVFWRIRGIVGFLRGRTDWGKMDRQGFNYPTAAVIEPGATPAAQID